MALQMVTAESWQEEVLGEGTSVLVDFYADWCYPCKALTPVLEQLAGEKGDGLKIVKLDTDRYQEFSEELGVRTIPTLIYFRDGLEVGRVVNPRVRQKIDELLESSSG